MKRICVLLMLCLLLGGCGKPVVETVLVEPSAPVPAPTVPADGNPRDVTSKGSYSVQPNPSGLVARVGDASLSNGQLQAWYWATAAKYRNLENGPDFSRPLDTQPCQIDDSVNSWQQYILREALNAWHTAQALIAKGAAEGLPTEEGYNPIKGNHEKYMDGKPAAQYLYGYHKSYQPNSMHQAYLDGIPQQMDAQAQAYGYADAHAYAQGEFGTTGEELERFVQDYNLGYMYFTSLSHYFEPTQQEILQFRQTLQSQAGDEEILVTFRQILLEDQGAAEAMLQDWGKENRVTEGTFATLAHKHSLDSGSQKNGGLYRNVSQAQLLPELQLWLMDPARELGDTAVLTSAQGSHILYFSGRTEAGALRAETLLHRQHQQQILENAREAWPIQIQHHRISLQDALGTVTAEQLLYADIAHERFPEVPLYIQQDYGGIRYNGSDVTRSGCGITTMAMLASYMTDNEWTVPELCARYGRYGGAKGTSGSLFMNEPPEMGFYLIDRVYDHREAKQYLDQGYMMVVVQHKGFWTRGGHYLLLEKIDEDGVQVRDSNLYNYARLEEHKLDRFPWDCITPKGKNYWIYDSKVKTIPACTRCGSGEGLVPDYLCEKCETALLRRGTYLEDT